MKRIATSVLAVVTLAALPALAQTETVPAIEDTDGSGNWSVTELQVAYPELTEENFTTIDTNVDGAVDQAELAAAQADGTLPAATEAPASGG